jgi:flavin reductase (DIM6/NTAB) family NADH-FMN oxidoreductase RutF
MKKYDSEDIAFYAKWVCVFSFTPQLLVVGLSLRVRLGGVEK